jgi:hypothetical protein
MATKSYSCVRSFIFPLLVVFKDSVGMDDNICPSFVVSQCMWWYGGFSCVGTTVDDIFNACGRFIIIYFSYINVYISSS